jgi:hypothetical protein
VSLAHERGSLGGRRRGCPSRVQAGAIMWKRCGSDKPQQNAAAMGGTSLAEWPERQAAVDRSSCSRLTSKRSHVRAGHRPSSRAAPKAGSPNHGLVTAQTNITLDLDGHVIDGDGIRGARCRPLGTCATSDCSTTATMASCQRWCDPRIWDGPISSGRHAKPRPWEFWRGTSSSASVIAEPALVTAASQMLRASGCPAAAP